MIAVDGELDLANASRLREMLIRSIAEESRGTTLDLHDCTFIDSSGIGVIVEAGHLLDDRLRQLRVMNLRDQPRQVFELTLVDQAPFIEVV